jgi:antitoxin component YwqK of YwqJK toxin-antitoxin module
MRKTILFIFFLQAISVFAQKNWTDAKGLKQGVWEKTYESGKVRYRGQFKDDVPFGKFEYYYESGAGLMSTVSYRGTSGVGYAVAYHRNGQKMAEGLYNDQRKDSTWTYYDEAGVLTQREQFELGTQTGRQITYYENGAVAEIIEFQNGVEHGLWLRKWSDGKQRTNGTFEAGHLEGDCKYFDEAGKLIAKGKYHNGLKHESWYYIENGEVVRMEVYRYGKLESETVYKDEQTEE